MRWVCGDVIDLIRTPDADGLPAFAATCTYRNHRGGNPKQRRGSGDGRQRGCVGAVGVAFLADLGHLQQDFSNLEPGAHRQGVKGQPFRKKAPTGMERSDGKRNAPQTPFSLFRGLCRSCSTHRGTARHKQLCGQHSALCG